MLLLVRITSPTKRAKQFSITIDDSLLHLVLAAKLGFEPKTVSLSKKCSTIELLCKMLPFKTRSRQRLHSLLGNKISFAFAVFAWPLLTVPEDRCRPHHSLDTALDFTLEPRMSLPFVVLASALRKDKGWFNILTAFGYYRLCCLLRLVPILSGLTCNNLAFSDEPFYPEGQNRRYPVTKYLFSITRGYSVGARTPRFNFSHFI